MKHKNTQPLYIFNRENPQNSEPQNGPRSGLDYIALALTLYYWSAKKIEQCWDHLDINKVGKFEALISNFRGKLG